MKSRFALFCKTFAPDIERFERLLTSIEQYGEPGLRLVVSLPRADKQLFHSRLGTGRFETLLDEDILERTTRQNWRGQQLVKLHAARVGFADAWLWVDSDSYFIRSFGERDFVHQDGSVAFSVSLLQHRLDDNEAGVLAYLDGDDSAVTLSPDVLKAWQSQGSGLAAKRSVDWQRLKDRLRKPPVDSTLKRVQHFFGRSGELLEFMPCSIWTSDSVLSFEREVLTPRNWTFETIIRYAPWEAVWIGEWELYRGAPNRYFIQPTMLHIRDDATILRARSMGISEQRVASRYFGLALAARHQELQSLDAPSA